MTRPKIKRLSTVTTLLLAVASACSALAESAEFCPTRNADFNVRQLAEFSNDEPYGQEEGLSAKHIPFLTISEDGETGTVVVGNGDDGGVWHPMVAYPGVVHFITHIFLKDQDGEVVAIESSDPSVGAPATMTFTVKAGTTELTPYCWCNLHGLWVGPTTAVPTILSNSPTCGVSHFPEGAWSSVHADFMRMQKDMFNSTVPFSDMEDEHYAKHTPHLTLKGDGTASVLVGEAGGITHPMNGSPDGISQPHFITELYIMDQNNNIVVMESLDTTGVDTATLDFDVPKGAESLKVYAWCNLHGLWSSPAVEVASVSVATADDESSSTGVALLASASALMSTALLTAFNI